MSKAILKRKLFKIISENTKGMERKQIAKKLSISLPAVSLLMRHSEATFSAEKLLDYCVVLGINVEYNIDGKVIKHTIDRKALKQLSTQQAR